MNLLVLGRGKTSALVAQIACERGHSVRVLSSQSGQSNPLTLGALADTDVVIDFTTPGAVLGNVTACARAGTNIVVGTTGWHHDLPRVRDQVDTAGIGLLHSASFSLTAIRCSPFPSTLHQQPAGSHMTPCHYARKRAARCGIASMLHKLLSDHAGLELDVSSVRADQNGTHVMLKTVEGALLLPRAAVSGNGFAEGAVRAAEWLEGRRGFFEFKDIYPDV